MFVQTVNFSNKILDLKIVDGSRRVRMRSSREWMRFSQVWMRSSRVWMRSSQVVRASAWLSMLKSDSSGFSTPTSSDTVESAPDKAVLKNVLYIKRKKVKKFPFKNFFKAAFIIPG
jgi:hypothetical protein